MKYTRSSLIALCMFLAAHACIAQNSALKFRASGARPATVAARLILAQGNQLAFRTGWSRAPRLLAEHVLRADSVPSKTDTVPSKTDSLPQHTEGVSTKEAKVSYRDSAVSNVYGDLLEDDPEANPRSPVWVPILGFIQGNILTWGVDRYVSNEDFARIGFQSWKRNFEVGFEWDSDGFDMNHFFHPYGGAMAFTGGRASGYGFFESIPFAFGSSLMWEMFGENSLPSYNDLINTTLSGAFGGEVLYRLSSNILDDRATGTSRFLREFFATIINPKRGFGRLIAGRAFHVSSREVYQKEPLNVTFSAGVHNSNDGSAIGTGVMTFLTNAQFVYGNPFESRSRKPFDFFKLRFDMNFGGGVKVIDNIIGYGLLFGTNSQVGNLKYMAGGFQHYDFWDNSLYQVSSLGIGGGVITQLPILANSMIESVVHLAIIPLGGVSSPYVSEGDRNYAYGGGMQAKLENIIDVGWGSLTTDFFFYWIHTYVGAAGDNVIGIFKPRLAVHLYQNLSIGFEYLFYQRNAHFADYPNFDSFHTEQKIYLALNLQNFGLAQ